MRPTAEMAGRSRRRFIATVGLLTVLPSRNATSQTMFILTLDGFEKSSFLKAYKPEKKSDWVLKTGGRNYSYTFADPDGTDEKVSVELSSEPFLLTRMGVSFRGTSLSNTATFTQRKERFLRDLLASTHPDLPIEKVTALVKSEQARNYAGGSDQMPRVPMGNARLFVGTVGVSLIVGLQR